MTQIINKYQILKNIFAPAVAKDKLPIDEIKLLQSCLGKLKDLSTHQFWLSRLKGSSLPKSLEITACELATRFKLELNSLNLALVLYYLFDCYQEQSSSQPDRINSQLETLSKKIQNIKNIKNLQDHPSPLKLKDNSELNYVRTIINSIIQSNQVNFFNNIIAEAKQGRYKNTYFTHVYERNNMLHDEVPLYSGNQHYKFMSPDTHLVPGVLGLTSKGQVYDPKEYIKSINAYAEEFTQVHLTQESCKCIDPYELKEELKKLFPPANSNSEQIINFYKNNKWQLTLIKDQKPEGNRRHITHIIQPVLIHDRRNSRYYLNFEVGREKAFLHRERQIRYNLYFSGNGVTQADNFYRAKEFITLDPDSIQVLTDYPHKGLNHALNPDLAAYRTSFKGSINPHLATYNHYEQLHKGNFDLEIYAFSIGVPTSSLFVERLHNFAPQRKIFYFAQDAMASFAKAAQASVGNCLSSIANNLQLLENVDVSQALNHENISVLICNNKADPIIKEQAQLKIEQLDKVRNKKGIYLQRRDHAVMANSNEVRRNAHQSPFVQHSPNFNGCVYYLDEQAQEQKASYADYVGTEYLKLKTAHYNDKNQDPR